jgi:hypothetical protein
MREKIFGAFRGARVVEIYSEMCRDVYRMRTSDERSEVGGRRQDEGYKMNERRLSQRVNAEEAPSGSVLFSVSSAAQLAFRVIRLFRGYSVRPPAQPHSFPNDSQMIPKWFPNHPQWFVKCVVS